MLNENIRALRKAKGLSQDELAVKLSVVRQTVSKWEQGLSVPDADLLIALSEALEVPVSTLLGETVTEPELQPDDIKALSERLEVINLHLAREKEARRRRRHATFIALSVLIVAVFVFLLLWHSPYLGWDYSDPETAVAGTVLHAFEFVFVRIAPFALIGTGIGAVVTRKRA